MRVLAALPGVNQFREVTFLYYSVVERPHPCLLAPSLLQQSRALKLSTAKKASTGGVMLALDLGKGGRFNVSYRVAQGATRLRGVLPTLRHNQPRRWLTNNTHQRWPNATDARGGRKGADAALLQG
jgi:hypothetical protein